uniref:PH domain-containing protein n=1 Tax=Oryza rufipogon TaxID=4529 RepID=A0A0E0MXP3_ORYRU
MVECRGGGRRGTTLAPPPANGESMAPAAAAVHARRRSDSRWWGQLWSETTAAVHARGRSEEERRVVAEIAHARRRSASRAWSSRANCVVFGAVIARGLRLFARGDEEDMRMDVWKKNLPCARARKPFVVSSLDLLMLLHKLRRRNSQRNCSCTHSPIATRWPTSTPLRIPLLPTDASNMSNPKAIPQLLGARSSEKAARWIRTMESALKPPRKDELVSCSHTRWQAFRWDAAHARAFKLQENNDAYMLSRCSNRMHSIGWTVFSSVHNDPMASDVIAPSPWTIFDCKNGFRLFTEAKDGGSEGKIDLSLCAIADELPDPTLRGRPPCLLAVFSSLSGGGDPARLNGSDVNNDRVWTSDPPPYTQDEDTNEAMKGEVDVLCVGYMMRCLRLKIIISYFAIFVVIFSFNLAKQQWKCMLTG